MQTLKLFNLRKLWLSLLLLVGATAIAIPGIQEIAADGNVAKIGDTEYATLQEAINAAQNGKTVTLFANTTENVVVAAGQNITLSIEQDATLSGGGSSNKKAAIENKGTLTIQGSGTIKREDTAAANGDGQAAYYVILNNGTMTISGVTVTNDSGPSAEGGLWSGSSLICNGTTNTSPSLTISGGTYTQNNFIVIKNDDYGTLKITGGTFKSNNQAVQNWSTTTISGGTFYGNVYSWAWEGNGAQSNPTVTISGGTFNNGEIGTAFDGNVNSNSPKVSITNGTFNNVTLTEAEGSELSISGGKFTVQPDETLLANGMTIVKTSATQWTVVSESEASNYNVEFTGTNGSSYMMKFGRTLNNSGIYKLLKDITLTGYINPGASATNATIDLNGHTLTSTATDEAILLSRPGSAAENLHKKFNLIDSSTEGGGKLVVNPNAEHAILLNNVGTSNAKYTDVIIGKGVTIDGGCISMLSDNSTLNLEGTINGGNNFAVVTNGNTKSTNITIKNGAVLTSNGVAMYLPAGEGSTTTIEEGAKITGSTGIYVKSGTLNIEGGEITGNGEKKDYQYWDNGCHSTGDALVVDNCGYPGGDPVVSVTGGTFTSTNANAIGSYNYGENAKLGRFVSGGYFSNQISDDLCIEGKTVIEATDKPGYFTIGDPHYVAQIGETGYVTLQAALDAAHEMTGDVTVELLDNISGYSIAHQKAGLNLTIDGAEKTIAGQIFIDGNGRASGTETLTIKNVKFEGNTSNFYSGTDAFILVPSTKDTDKPWTTGAYNYAHNITVTDCSFTSTSTSNAYDVVCIKATSGAGAYNVVINNCTASGTKMHSLAQLTGTTGGTVANCTVTGSESFVNVSGGTGDFTISGNTFTSDEGADGYGIRENGTSSAVITLTDNTFTAANAVVMGKGSNVTVGIINVVSGTYVGDITKTDAATGKIAISGGKFSAQLGNESYADFIAEGYMGMNNIYSDETTPNGVVPTDKAVMYTNANGVTTFTDDFPGTLNDGTYTLLKDVTRTMRTAYGLWANNVTIDLNGHTLTSTVTDCAITMGRAGSESSPRNLNIVSSNGSGTLKVNVPNSSSTSAINVTGKYNIITIGEDVTIDGGSVALLGENETLTVNGTINGGDDFAVATNGSTTKNTTITINEGAVLTSNVTAIYLPGNEGLSATINGGTITGGDAGVEVRAGNLVVNGGTITTTATDYNYTPNGSGTTTKGAAIAVVQHNTKLPIDAQILGGTLTGLNQIAVVDAQENNLEDVSVRAKDDLIVTTTIPVAFKWVSNGDGTSSLAPRDAVAQIGETKYYSLADAVAAVPTDGTQTTITMIANEMINVTGYAITIPATKNVVLDLNGYQIVGTVEQEGTSALIRNLGTLTIKDSSDTNKDGSGTGKLMSGASTTWTWDGSDDYSGSYASNLIRNEKDLIVESGYLYNMSTGSAAYAIDNYSAGNVTINGGKVDVAKASAIRMFYVSGGSITVNDGIIGHYNSDNDCTYMGIQVMSGDNVNVSVKGGTIAGDYAFYANNTGGNIAISGGTFDGYVAFGSAGPNDISITGGAHYYVDAFGSQTKFVSGGIYTYEVDEAFIADGYILTDNTDPETKDAYPYAVRQANYICAIGDTKYETLADAVAAAGTAETTITLLTEAATDGVISGDGLVVPSGSNITFDLNGLTYDVSGVTVGSSNTKTLGFQLLKESNITFKNGTLKATSPTAKMLIQNYSNLTLESVNLDGTGLSGVAYALSNNCGTINLTGSTSITAKTGGRAFDTCKFGSYAIPTVNINTTGAITGPIEATGGKLNIENGKFNVTWVTDNNYTAGDIQIKGGVFSEEPAEEYCASGYVTTDNEDEATKEDYPYTVMSKEDAGIFELLDWEPYPYKDDTADRNATSITYKRKFPSNNYNAWYVPFDYNITEEDLQNFDFYKFHMISASSSTGNANVNNVSAAYIHLQKITTPGTKLRGNSPYVIVLKNAVDETAVYEFNMEGDNLKLLKPNNNSAFQMMSADFDYDFFGTYAKYGSTKDYEWFALNSGRLSPNTKGASINQYRWVLKLTPRGENSDYSKINFGFIEDEEATGLSTISPDEDNQIEGIYSVNGSKLDNLEKGINIIRYKNGTTKKVIIK